MDMSRVDLGSEKIENAQQVAMISQIWLKSNPLRDHVFSFLSRFYKPVDLLSLPETVCLEGTTAQELLALMIFYVVVYCSQFFPDVVSKMYHCIMIKKVMTVLRQEGQKEKVAYFTPHIQYVTVCEHAHII